MGREPTDAELMAAVRAGDRSAVDVLIHRHTGLVKAVVRRVAQHSQRADRDDLIQLGLVALWRLITDTGESAWRPDAAGTGIGPYAHQRIVWAVLKGLRSDRRPRPRPETDMPSELGKPSPLDEQPAKPVGPDGPLLSGTEAAVVEGVLAGEDRGHLARRLNMTPGVVRRVFLSALKTVREADR